MLEYCVVLIGFLFMYMFIWPQSDVFLFAQATDGSLGSAWDFSINYGNGRLLGNLIGVFFSTHFAFAGIIVAVILMFIVHLLNNLLFDSNPYAVFPLALLIALPSSGIVTECYYLFAGFCNYVIPMALLLLSIQILKAVHKGVPRLQTILLMPALFVCGFSCCLFSENTSIVAVVAASAMVFYHSVRAKKQSLPLLVNLFSVLAGTVVMFLIPILTGTGEKMDSYRQVATGLSGIIHQCIVSFSVFAEVLNHCHLLLFLISFAMILLCLNQNHRWHWLKSIQLTVFASYPFLCLGLNLLDCHSIIGGLTIVRLADAALLVIYGCNILFTLAFIADKFLRLRCCLIFVVTACSVLPMMVVSMSGHRTYYTTFLCLIVFSFFVIRACLPASFSKITGKPHFQKLLSFAACGCFAFISAVLLMLSAYNYDFYVIRSTYMAEKITCGESLVVPPVPCESISTEDDIENIIFFTFENDANLEKAVISLTYWDGFEYYRDQVINNPIRTLSFALENWHYKNPLYPESLCK